MSPFFELYVNMNIVFVFMNLLSYIRTWNRGSFLNPSDLCHVLAGDFASARD